MTIHAQLSRLQAIMNLSPSENLMEETERICASEPACRLFWCERLEKIEWFPLMVKRNWFTNPPNIMRDGDKITYPLWVESVLLFRFAKRIPSEIANVLVATPPSDNARVADQIFRIAAEFRQISDIRLVREKIRSVLKDHRPTARLWLVDLLRNWMNAGAADDVIKLLPQVLVFDPGDKESVIHPTDAWELGEIDQHVLAPLASTAGKELVTILSSVLDKLIGRERREDVTSTSVWLEDFLSRREYGHEKESIIVLRIYAASRDLIERDHEEAAIWVNDFLCSYVGALFQRLRWQLYCDFPQYFLNQARYEVLQRIPQMSRVPHGFEFRNMIDIFAKRDGSKFLSDEELSRIVEAVSKGPLDEGGKIDAHEGYVARFRAKQIDPFRTLLKDKQLFALRNETGEEVKFRPEDYKPFQLTGESHVVEQRSPVTKDALAKLPDDELWELLNTWSPDPQRRTDKWWIEEGVDGLATTFAEAVELNRSRFSARTKWWEKLKRPAFFWRLLDRALVTENALEPNDDSWATWFGLCEFVVRQQPIERPDEKGTAEDTSALYPTWKYARWSAARLIERALKYKGGPPPQYAEEIANLLKKLSSEEDPRVEEIEKSWSSSSFDWLSKGINSAAGTAIEGLLLFALWQKKLFPKEHAPAWVTEVLSKQLTKENQSPAIFAVLGSQLPLLASLFPEWCKNHHDTVFPFRDRQAHAEAALLSHLGYNNPNGLVIAAFPTMLDHALRVVNFEEQQGRRTAAREEMPVRLGYHIAYYYWNALPEEGVAERRLDEFFQKAPAPVRGRLIAEIGRIFKRAPSESDELTKRVRALWEKRSAVISDKLARDPALLDEFAPELASFSYWVGNECFDAAWRLARLMQILKLSKKSPDAFDLLEALDKLSADPNNLKSVMRCLLSLTEKFSDNLRWSIREEHLKGMLKRGLQSTDSQVRTLAESARDNLLKEGLFIYQDV